MASSPALLGLHAKITELPERVNPLNGTRKKLVDWPVPATEQNLSICWANG
jgi:hypothetical protein